MTTSKTPQDTSMLSVCVNCGKSHRTLTPEQCQDRSMSEKTLQNRVVDRAKRRGWTVAHVGRGIAAFDANGAPVYVTAMSAGWPDLLLFKPNAQPPVIAMELKREQGEVSDDQWRWLSLMNACSIPAIVVRPSDLREGRVSAILGAL